MKYPYLEAVNQSIEGDEQHLTMGLEAVQMGSELMAGFQNRLIQLKFNLK